MHRCMYQTDLFFRNTFIFLLRSRVFLAVSAARHVGGSRAHHDASVRPSRAPWRVLWALKVAKSGKQSQGGFSPSQAGQRKPRAITVHLFTTAAQCCLPLFLVYRSRSQRLGSRGTTVVAALPFVTATNGTGAAACVHVYACCVSYRDRNRQGQVQFQLYRLFCYHVINICCCVRHHTASVSSSFRRCSVHGTGSSSSPTSKCYFRDTKATNVRCYCVFVRMCFYGGGILLPQHEHNQLHDYNLDFL